MLTFFTTTTLGAAFSTGSMSGWLAPGWVRSVWTDPGLLRQGLAFALPVLTILMIHELGHYLTCRRYGLPATLPYFLPAPFGIGTVGAFIKIRAPIRGKRELFDVGASGPFAGFLALLPFLYLGLARSRPVALAEVAPPQEGFFLLGSSLLMELAARLFHGPLPEGTVLDLHPFALAAWFGLLATAINLLPLGQLDGGHILYAATGRLQRRVALPLWGLLALASLIWPGWIFWTAIVLLMGLRHPPVRDEAEPLDRGRQALAVAALLLFVLCFMPVPIREVVLGAP